MPDHPQEQDILEQEKKAVEEIIAIKPITAENAAFTRTQGGFLQLVYAGKTYPRVAVHRCFPFSDPDHYISIREPETDGREIGLIIDLKALPKELQTLLEEQLALRYFVPRTHRVKETKRNTVYSVLGGGYPTAVHAALPCGWAAVRSMPSVIIVIW